MDERISTDRSDNRYYNCADKSGPAFNRSSDLVRNMSQTCANSILRLDKEDSTILANADLGQDRVIRNCPVQVLRLRIGDRRTPPGRITMERPSMHQQRIVARFHATGSHKSLFKRDEIHVDLLNAR